MNKQRKVLITTTYNEMGIIIDTKAEEVAQPNLQPTCNQLATDCISRQAAIDVLEREKTYCTAFRDGYTPINVFEKYNAGLTDGIKALKNLPAAPVREVVPCRDCKNYEPGEPPVGWCRAWRGATLEEEFCSFAERMKAE